MRKHRKLLDFTDETIRGLTMQEGEKYNAYYDRGCPHLSVVITDSTASYFYTGNKTKKLIGNAFQIPVTEARSIVHNIDANFDEFMGLELPTRFPYYKHYTQHGPLPLGTVTVEAEVVQPAPGPGWCRIEHVLQLETELKKVKAVNMLLHKQIMHIDRIIHGNNGELFS